MSLLFMDGLDCYDDLGDVIAPGKLVSNSNDTTRINLAPAGGRFGGGALQSMYAGGNFYVWRLIHPLSLSTDYIFGASVQISAAESAARDLFWLEDASQNVALYITATLGGGMQVKNASGTVVGASNPTTGLLPANVWTRVEFKFNMGSSTSTGSIEIRVNDVTVVTLSAQNFFRSGGGASIAMINTNTSGIVRSFDDITLCDTTGDVNNTFLGDIRIDTLKPSGDTVQKDWTLSAGTAGYALIDDPNGASDGDTTYVSSQVVGNKSEFALSNIIGQSSAINAVQTRVKAKKTDVGTRRYRAYLKSGSAVSNGPEITPPVGSYSWPTTNGLYEKDPNGSLAWTDAAVNNLQLGIELTA